MFSVWFTFASLMMVAGLSCGITVDARDAPPPEPVMSTPAPDEREVITIGISLYLLVGDTRDPNSTVSTARTVDGLMEILDGLNEIWGQADVRFEARHIGPIEVPEPVLLAVHDGDFRVFFNSLGRDINIPSPGTINGFYAKSVGGPNGINPFRSRSFLVTDNPSVHDRRVTSHEIGHILGLHHALSDPDRLMFSGTNGMTLTEDEATVARYVAKGILDRVR